MKHERGSCGTRCSRISALRKASRTACGTSIGRETKRPTVVPRPTGTSEADLTYS
jgi:hypothetical protein